MFLLFTSIEDTRPLYILQSLSAKKILCLMNSVIYFELLCYKLEYSILLLYWEKFSRDGKIYIENRGHFHKLAYFARAVMTSQHAVICISTLQIHLKKSVTLWCNYQAIMDHFNVLALFVADIKRKVIE